MVHSGSLESMQLMETVVNNINAKYVGMKREAKSVGKLSKVLEARGAAMAGWLCCCEHLGVVV
jgi:hypothetical protein